LFEDKARRLIFFDVGSLEFDLGDNKTRKVMHKYIDRASWEKAGIIGASPISMMMAKIMMSILGKSKKTRFFKSESEALVWLKGEHNGEV